MLGNIVRVRHAGNLVRYVLGKPRAQILEVDSLTQDPRQLAKEIERLAEHRPRLKKLVAHADIDLRPGLRLSDKEWREVARRVRERMGFANSPFLLVRHHDAGHDHVHLLMGTVRYDGSVVKDSFEIKRFHAAVGEVAQAFSMQVERAPDRSAGHRSQYWAHRRGDPLKEIVQEAYETPTFASWQARLKARGVEPSYHLRRDGHLQGLAFRFESRWVKARALGKQFAAAQVRKQYQLSPEDRQLMVRQNQLLGRGRTEVSVPSQEPGRPEALLKIEPEGVESRPALGVSHPGPPPRMPPRSRRLESVFHALEQPTMPLAAEQYVHRQRPAPSTWLETVVARRIHPERVQDPTYHATARLVASRLVEAPERHPRLVLRLAREEPPNPRLSALLDRIDHSYAPESHLSHLAADPDAYAPKYRRLLELRSQLIDAKIQQAPDVAHLGELKREIRATLLPRRHFDPPRFDLRAWRRQLTAGHRTDVGPYLVAYKRRLENNLSRRAPSLRGLLAGMNERALSLPSTSPERYGLLGRAASLEAYLALHPPRPGRSARPRRPRRPQRSRLYDVLRYAYSPPAAARFDLAQRVYRGVKVDQAVRAFRRMRSPLRGVVREIANSVGRPYLAAAVLLPAAVLQRHLRRRLERGVLHGFFDLSIEQKVLLRLLRGRPLSAAMQMVREGLTSGVER